MGTDSEYDEVCKFFKYCFYVYAWKDLLTKINKCGLLSKNPISS